MPATQLKLRGGTTAEHSTFTGSLREVTVDTDKNTIVVHDGTTAGGHPLALETAGAVPDPLSLTSITATTTLGIGSGWTVTESGGSLYFATGGANLMKLDAAGNLDVVGNVNTNSTIT
jgi:hypothetical protein